MTWYIGVPSEDAINAGDEPFESEDELLEHLRQNPAQFPAEPYLVELNEGRKMVFRARFKNGKWERDPLFKYSTPPSEH